MIDWLSVVCCSEVWWGGMQFCFFQAEDGIRDAEEGLEFRRVRFRSEESAARRPELRILQAEGRRVVVIGEHLGITPPADHRTQGLLGGVRRHVILQFVEEAAFRCLMAGAFVQHAAHMRSEEHTSELQSLMRISYAVFCLKTKTKENQKQKINYIS